MDLYHTCIYFFDLRIHLENYRFKKQWPADRLPLPPPRLIYRVTGQYKIEPFLENGALGAKCIQDILAKNGSDIEGFQSILDFGCGCCRVMRHWSSLSHSRLYGTDYNASLIEWCRDALPIAEFSVNPLQGRLEYKDGQFDFVYSLSVFTHLNLSGQRFWINEMRRVLRLGGYLYLTVHGMRRSSMTREEQERFESGDLVVVGEEYTGHNACMAFSPEPYVRKVLAKDFTLVDFIPLGAEDSGQDVYLLQKPPAGLSPS
jgi:SAM-dependent methyltransferase